MRKGLFATLEDETGLAQQVGEQGPVVPEVVAEVAEGSAELSQDAGEVGDLVAQVEDAGLADQELQQVADTMQQSIDEGVGLDTGAAQMAEIATESIMNRLGLKGQRVIPATEAFGSSNSRVAATRIAMESVMDRIKSIWKGILDFLKMIWTKITDFFSKFFANAEKLEKAAETLKGKVGEYKGKKASSDEFDDAGIAKAFAAGAGKNDAKACIEILKRQESMLQGVKGTLATSYTMVSAFARLGSGITSGATINMDDIISKGESLVKSASFDGTNGKDVSKGDRVSTEFGPFYNGTLVKLSLDMKDGEISAFDAEFTEIEKSGEGKKNVTLAADGMTKVLEQVIVLAKQAQEFKKTSSELKKVTDELTKATESVIKGIDGGLEGKENAADIRKALATGKSVVTGSAKIVSRMSTQAPVMAVKAGNAALKYVQASMKEYKEEKKEDKK